MKHLLIKLIKIYQSTPTQMHTLCRHLPTCSQYTLEAIEKYGSIKGLHLGLRRILKCRKGGTYGYDPVP